MGLLLLSRGYCVKIDLFGTMVFVLALVPIHPAQIAWAISAVANALLLQRSYNVGLVAMIREPRW